MPPRKTETSEQQSEGRLTPQDLVLNKKSESGNDGPKNITENAKKKKRSANRVREFKSIHI